jgi:hypothetical protein
LREAGEHGDRRGSADHERDEPVQSEPDLQGPLSTSGMTENFGVLSYNSMSLGRHAMTTSEVAPAGMGPSW